MPDRKTVKTIQKDLLDWFQDQKRDLPWRDTKDPYPIWVSEIMLQQTQVKTVVPYYQRWLKSFPDIKKLAAAPEAQVLKHWEGLGYYSRARNLRRAAKIVMREHAGKVPDDFEAISRLPGIGRYTAGAILSIAFGQRVPVVDGNVKRVLSRLFKIKGNGSTTGSENFIWETADRILPDKRVGDFNQSLMELGATLCLPRKPMCLPCPVASVCQARKENVQANYPPPKPKTPSKKLEVSAAVIFRNRKVYIQQRLHAGLMGGLWEFPGGKQKKNESMEDCLRREIKEELDLEVRIDEKLMTINHCYTRFRVTLHVYLCRPLPGRVKASQCERWLWVRPEDLDAYPFPAANVRIVERLRNESSGGPLRSGGGLGRR